MGEKMLIAPSILNADNLNLKKSIQKVSEAGAVRFHIDIMDGHFVPNLSFGPELVRNFKREFPLNDAEIHLMSDAPKNLVPEFVDAGADLIELHYEAMSEDQMIYWLDYCLSNNVKTALVINPNTKVSKISKFLDKIDQLLIMTVNPGFGGQSFLTESINRIKQAKQIIKLSGKKIPIEVDGGINHKTLNQTKEAGAEIFVIGSYLFKSGDIINRFKQLNKIVKK